MKKLVLLRHAKSSWNDAGVDDHDRPLSKRGRESAPVIGRWLAEHGHVPDLVLCSSSARTLETVRRLALPGLPEPVVERALYHAAPETILARLAALPPECGTAMLVGHNPSTHQTARALAGAGESHWLAEIARKFPTAAAAVIEFEGSDWSAVRARDGVLIDFLTPK